MSLKPLGKRVLIQREAEQTTTASGIILPDNAKEKPSQGEVVAVSNDVAVLACGDKVVFGKYSGNEISLDAEKYLVIDVEDIFGIIS